MYELTIILRTCDRVNAFSGTRPRDFGSKIDVIKKCFLSLKKSIDHFKKKGNNCNLVIVDDHSSVDTINFFKENADCTIVSLSNTGNGASFGACVDLAKKLSGLVFLLEDDYLLKEECLASMVESYHKIKSEYQIPELCMYPSDYPDRYNSPYPSLVLLGSDRHYRSIRHTTCTFMYDATVFSNHESKLKRFCNYGILPGITEDNSINLIYKDIMCLSPIPSLAEHYQYKETLSPFYKEQQ